MFELVMAETVVKVYHGNLTTLPDVSKVLACLHEKEVKYEVVNMNKGHHAVPVDFHRLQEKASNRVPGPAFQDGANVLFDPRAICRHLSEKYAERGNRSLLGNDPLERASVEQWLRSEEHSFDPPSWTLVFHIAFAPRMNYEPDRILIQENERKLSEVLDVYNQKLGETKYLAGNEFSLADLAHLPNSHYLANSKEWSYLFTSRKNVNKWWKNISERQSWFKAIKVVDHLAEDQHWSSLLPTPKPIFPQKPVVQKSIGLQTNSTGHPEKLTTNKTPTSRSKQEYLKQTQQYSRRKENSTRTDVESSKRTSSLSTSRSSHLSESPKKPSDQKFTSKETSSKSGLARGEELISSTEFVKPTETPVPSEKVSLVSSHNKAFDL